MTTPITLEHLLSEMKSAGQYSCCDNFSQRLEPLITQQAERLRVLEGAVVDIPEKLKNELNEIRELTLKSGGHPDIVLKISVVKDFINFIDKTMSDLILTQKANGHNKFMASRFCKQLDIAEEAIWEACGEITKENTMAAKKVLETSLVKLNFNLIELQARRESAARCDPADKKCDGEK